MSGGCMGTTLGMGAAHPRPRKEIYLWLLSLRSGCPVFAPAPACQRSPHDLCTCMAVLNFGPLGFLHCPARCCLHGVAVLPCQFHSFARCCPIPGPHALGTSLRAVRSRPITLRWCGLRLGVEVTPLPHASFVVTGDVKALHCLLQRVTINY